MAFSRVAALPFDENERAQVVGICLCSYVRVLPSPHAFRALVFGCCTNTLRPHVACASVPPPQPLSRKRALALTLIVAPSRLPSFLRPRSLARARRPAQGTFADSRHHCSASLALECSKLVAALRISVDDKVDPAVAQVADAVVQEHLVPPRRGQRADPAHASRDPPAAAQRRGHLVAGPVAPANENVHVGGTLLPFSAHSRGPCARPAAPLSLDVRRFFF